MLTHGVRDVALLRHSKQLDSSRLHKNRVYSALIIPRNKRVTVGMVITLKSLLRLLVVISTFLGQVSSQPSGTRQESSKTKAASPPSTVAAIQKSLVKQLQAGASLDSRIPDSMFQELKYVHSGNAGTVQDERSEDLPPKPTYAEALKWIAKQRAADIIRIHVEAVPMQCTIKYSAITDQSYWFDLGLTTVDRPLHPNYYALRCECAKGTEEQKVDCTTDCSTRFSCGNGTHRR